MTAAPSLTRRKSLLALLAGTALAAAGAASTAAPPPARDVQAYRRLVTDLTKPEMEGRGAGTKGIEKARDYLAEQFLSAGLTPAFGKSYLQPFSLSLHRTVTAQSLEIVGPAGGKVVGRGEPGQQVTIQFRRGAKTMTVEVTLARRPRPPATSPG